MTNKTALANIFSKVKFRDSEYILLEVIYWRDRVTKECRYSCTLLDKNGNSSVRADIEKVELDKNERNII